MVEKCRATITRVSSAITSAESTSGRLASRKMVPGKVARDGGSGPCGALRAADAPRGKYADNTASRGTASALYTVVPCVVAVADTAIFSAAVPEEHVAGSACDGSTTKTGADDTTDGWS